ncbi:hypothetical protein C27AD_03807 [Salinisphaera hydrothermalis C27AD]
MFRKSVYLDGMWFQFKRPRRVSFWMRDTWMPLDIIFIGPDHRVSGIIRNATPDSTRHLPSPGPVSAALEVAAGNAGRWAITLGDLLRLDRS